MPRDAAACLSEAYFGSTLLVTSTITTLNEHVRVALALEVAGDAQLPQGHPPCGRSYWRGCGLAAGRGCGCGCGCDCGCGWGGRRLRD